MEPGHTMDVPTNGPSTAPGDSPGDSPVDASGPGHWVRGFALAMAVLGLVTGIGWLLSLAFLAPRRDAPRRDAAALDGGEEAAVEEAGQP